MITFLYLVITTNYHGLHLIFIASKVMAKTFAAAAAVGSLT